MNHDHSGASSFQTWRKQRSACLQRSLYIVVSSLRSRRASTWTFALRDLGLRALYSLLVWSRGMADHSKKSPVWAFFQRPEGSNSVKCSLCMRKLVHKGGTTSSLIKHMEYVHPKEWKKAKAPPTTASGPDEPSSSHSRQRATPIREGPIDSFLRTKV